MVETPAMLSAMWPLTVAIEAADILRSNLEVVKYVCSRIEKDFIILMLNIIVHLNDHFRSFWTWYCKTFCLIDVS